MRSGLDRLRAELLAAVPRHPAEAVPLGAANGRWLAHDVSATGDFWPFDRAAMDGIAVAARDVADARPEQPVELAVSGSIYCGDAVAQAPAGAAVRIATGAPLPAGADAVVPQELVVFHNGLARVARPIGAGKNVFRRGEDMRAGDRVLAAGTRLHGAQIAALAALGVAEVAVVREPRVAIVACGDELLEPGADRGGGSVADTNSFMLAAEIDDLGARSERAGIVPDDPALVQAALAGALDADAIVTCGGLSVGERDFIRGALSALGARFVFEGAPIAPGHPVSVAFLRGLPVFALPGTPGACRVAFEAFVRPALLAMLGAANVERPRVWARLTRRIEVRPGRTRFVWAAAAQARGAIAVTPLSEQGTSTIRSASDAGALIVLPPGAAAIEAGLAVEAWLLADLPAPAEPDGPRAAVVFAGPKNAGKTTLIERLIPVLSRRGVRVGVLKRHGHMPALDEPGKDTFRAAAAGAAVTLLAGAPGFVERRAAPGATLDEALGALRGIDLVLVEGYADSDLAKVHVARHGFASDRGAPAPPIVARAGDVEPAAEGGPPAFGWNELDALADYLIARFLG